MKKFVFALAFVLGSVPFFAEAYCQGIMYCDALRRVRINNFLRDVGTDEREILDQLQRRGQSNRVNIDADPENIEFGDSSTPDHYDFDKLPAQTYRYLPNRQVYRAIPGYWDCYEAGQDRCAKQNQICNLNNLGNPSQEAACAQVYAACIDDVTRECE